MGDRTEVFISVDVETAGSVPGLYPMLSIGACLLDDPETGFYVELVPDSDGADPAAIAVSGLSLEVLRETGTAPEAALLRFEQWVADRVPDGAVPVFTAFNAPFDWMFVDHYFRRYLGRNPFGHSALDIKAYYMGKTGSTWANTSMKYLSPAYLGGRPLSHNALGDARDQAELFRAILAEPPRP